MDVFVHIPKSSGSTIRSIMSRHYGVKHIMYFEPNAPRKTEQRDPRTILNDELNKRKVDLLTGHYPFGVHLLANKPCRYFSMVREPIDRAISDYYYAFSYPHHRFREEIVSGRLPVEEFLTQPKYSPPGAQAGMLAGRSTTATGMVAAALENMKHSFVTVGVTERFEDSILQLAKLLGWGPPLFIQRNVTQLDDEVAGQRASARGLVTAAFEHHYRADYAVYVAADKALTAWIESEGEAYRRAADAFREIQNDIATKTAAEMFERYEFGRNDELPEFAARFAGSEPYGIISDYLRIPPTQRPRANYAGNVDYSSDASIRGWAADLNAEGPISVTLRRGGKPVATTVCNLTREDLLRAGLSSPVAGFRFDFDQPLPGTAGYTVCFADTALEIPWDRRAMAA